MAIFSAYAVNQKTKTDHGKKIGLNWESCCNKNDLRLKISHRVPKTYVLHFITPKWGLPFIKLLISSRNPVIGSAVAHSQRSDISYHICIIHVLVDGTNLPVLYVSSSFWMKKKRYQKLLSMLHFNKREQNEQQLILMSKFGKLFFVQMKAVQFRFHFPL